MFFAFRQFLNACKSVPVYYRFPGVGWRIVPFIALYGYRYFSDVVRYIRAVKREQVPEFHGDERLTVILINYDRIANMATLSDAFLRLPFVERVVISNNNPQYKIGDWVRSKDPRLVLIDQSERTKPGVRFDLAREHPADYYMTIDDDIFLTPLQIQNLFLAILENPESLHGITGQVYVGRDGTAPHQSGWESNIDRQSRSVEVLNCVYTLTREHLAEYFEILAERGVRKSREIGNGEDVLLSFCGTEPPRIHDLGSWLDCILSNDPRVALHQTLSDFGEEREGIYLSLRDRRSRDPAAPLRASRPDRGAVL